MSIEYKTYQNNILYTNTCLEDSLNSYIMWYIIILFAAFKSYSLDKTNRVFLALVFFFFFNCVYILLLINLHYSLESTLLNHVIISTAYFYQIKK